MGRTSNIERSRSAKAAATQPWKNLTCFSASTFWIKKQKQINKTNEKPKLEFHSFTKTHMKQHNSTKTKTASNERKKGNTLAASSRCRSAS